MNEMEENSCLDSTKKDAHEEVKEQTMEAKHATMTEIAISVWSLSINT